MGEKGPASADAAATAETLVSQLEPLGEVTYKGMFGGQGIFRRGAMFALVDRAGNSFLKADEVTSAKFTAAGAQRHGRMPYWRIPDEILNDNQLLLQWAAEASEMAINKKR